MRVEMRRGVIGEDGEHWGAGDVRDASEPFARWLIALGKAVLADVVDEILDRDPKPQNRDPKPRRRR